MKHFYTSLFSSSAKKLITVIAVLLISFTALSQTASPGLLFKNGTLKSGNAGQDGAVYLFPNVAPGVDGLITIAGRYASDGKTSNVVLTTMDETSTGYDSAWQPTINYVNGSSIKKNVVTEWYIEFQVAFVKAGTTTPTTVSSFDVTGLDIDGSSTLHEFMSLYNLKTYTLENPTSLTATSVTSQVINIVNGVLNFVNGILGTVSENGKRFDAGDTEYDGIDVNASKARVTNHYVNTSNFTMRMGANATGPFTIANGGRQNSVYFQSFAYTNPVVQTLPVNLVSFNAQLSSTSKTNLNWITAAETNASHFVVQRSIDGNTFDDVSIVMTEEGNSNSNRSYAYADDISTVHSSLVYYRLKMVDIDEKYTYSEVAVIRIEKQAAQANVLTFPNPAVSQVRVTIPANWQTNTITYTMFNLNGSMVQQKTTSNAGQTETFNIANIPAGLYLIEVKNGNQVAVQKFIKAK